MFGRPRENEGRRIDRGEDLFSDAEQYDQRGGFNNQNFYAEDLRPRLYETGEEAYPETPDNRASREGGAGRRFSSDYSREATTYAGKGPKGYVRSDERIHEEICETLTHDPSLDASDVEVSVESGTVTLTGTVARRQDRWRAEEHAEECFGVRDVRNELKVSDRKAWNAEWTRELENTRFPLYPFD
jgi:hypothetical protein